MRHHSRCSMARCDCRKEVAATTLPQLLREITLAVELSRQGRITLKELSARAGRGRLRPTVRSCWPTASCAGCRCRAGPRTFRWLRGLQRMADHPGQHDGRK